MTDRKPHPTRDSSDSRAEYWSKWIAYTILMLLAYCIGVNRDPPKPAGSGLFGPGPSRVSSPNLPSSTLVFPKPIQSGTDERVRLNSEGGRHDRIIGEEWNLWFIRPKPHWGNMERPIDSPESVGPATMSKASRDGTPETSSGGHVSSPEFPGGRSDAKSMQYSPQRSNAAPQPRP